MAYASGIVNTEFRTSVAVKMPRVAGRSREFVALCSEIKILGHIGKHPNVINLIGVCTTGSMMQTS